MLSSITTRSMAISAVIALTAIQLARADPDPSEPAPGEIFTEGETCHISWEADTTGIWTEMNIELMTGPNSPMVHLTTVATVDGTDTSVTSFDYTCPTVSLHSAVYFYQFTSPAASNVSWTGRFAITDSTGTTVDPPNTDVSDGVTVEWGTGALTNASEYTAAPSYVTPSTVAIATGSASAVSSSASVDASATSSVVKSASQSSTATASSDAAEATKSTANANTSSTNGVSMGREVQTGLALLAIMGSVAALL